jgi:hypothetical protein
VAQIVEADSGQAKPFEEGIVRIGQEVACIDRRSDRGCKDQVIVGRLAECIPEPFLGLTNPSAAVVPSSRMLRV